MHKHHSRTADPVWTNIKCLFNTGITEIAIKGRWQGRRMLKWLTHQYTYLVRYFHLSCHVVVCTINFYTFLNRLSSLLYDHVNGMGTLYVYEYQDNRWHWCLVLWCMLAFKTDEISTVNLQKPWAKTNSYLYCVPTCTLCLQWLLFSRFVPIFSQYCFILFVFFYFGLIFLLKWILVTKVFMLQKL